MRGPDLASLFWHLGATESRCHRVVALIATIGSVAPPLPKPGEWTGMASAQCLGAVEVEARENPSRLAARILRPHRDPG